MQFEIKNRFTGELQFTAKIKCNDDSALSLKIGLAVKWAVKTGADLNRADLSGANLIGADLSGADLSGANLSRANLSRANLSCANLSGAYLSGADLNRADLSCAYLNRANLIGADLSGANLSGANLSRANLSCANLSGADLSCAYLNRANLIGADLIDGGQRSDGYRFVGWIKASVLQIRAGCRSFTIEQARAHWAATRAGTPLGDETTAILDHIEAVAAIRGLLAKSEG